MRGYDDVFALSDYGFPDIVAVLRSEPNAPVPSDERISAFDRYLNEGSSLKDDYLSHYRAELYGGDEQPLGGRAFIELQFLLMTLLLAAERQRSLRVEGDWPDDRRIFRICEAVALFARESALAILTLDPGYLIEVAIDRSELMLACQRVFVDDATPSSVRQKRRDESVDAHRLILESIDRLSALHDARKAAPSQDAAPGSETGDVGDASQPLPTGPGVFVFDPSARSLKFFPGLLDLRDAIHKPGDNLTVYLTETTREFLTLLAARRLDKTETPVPEWHELKSAKAKSARTDLGRQLGSELVKQLVKNHPNAGYRLTWKVHVIGRAGWLVTNQDAPGIAASRQDKSGLAARQKLKSQGINPD